MKPMSRLKKLYMGVLALVLVAVAVTASYGWYYISKQMTGLSGSVNVVTNYFNGGDGSEEDPFQIDNHVQWYNLAYLQDMGYFDDEKVYFILTSDINMKDEDPVPPVGTETHPFIGELDGNGKTISNMKIVGKALTQDGDEYALCDIGIFGFVDSTAVIHDMYFESPTIMVSAASADAAILNAHATYAGGDAADTVHTVSNFTYASDGEDVAVAYVGYVAGHVEDTVTFSKVYVNDATIEGASDTTNIRNNWGYYGYVKGYENYHTTSDNSLTGEGDLGDTYAFTLNASNMYKYLADVYSRTNANSSKLVTRDLTITSNGAAESNETISTTTNFAGTAVTLSSSKYSLVGDKPNTDVTTNYSFSTAGYHGNSYVNVDHGPYEVYYLNEDGNYTLLPNTITQQMPSETEGETGFYYDSTLQKWMYYITEKRETPTYSVSFTGSFSNKFTNYDIDSSEESSGYLYLDGESYTVTYTASFGDSYSFTISDVQTDEISVLAGTHRVALLLTIPLVKNNGTKTTTYYYYGSLSNNKLTSKEVTVSSDGTINLGSLTYTNTSMDFSKTSSDVAPSSTVSIYNTSHDLYYKDDNGNYVSMTESSMTFAAQGEGYQITYTTSELDETSRAVYMGDEFASIAEYQGTYTLTYTTVDGVEKSKTITTQYNKNNIDIVGGLTFNSTYIHMEGYKNNMVDPVVGNTFSATDYPDSICLYMKNVKDATGNMGTITFTYQAIESGKNPSPQFTKGNSSALTFTSLYNANDGDSSTTSSANSNTVYSYTVNLSLTEVREASYCALDSTGKIIAVFNTSGTQTSLASGYAEDDIATYVLLLTVADGQIGIQEIDFAYVAADGIGTGGGKSIPDISSSSTVFGTVEYRSSPDTNLVNNEGQLGLLFSYDQAAGSEVPVTVSYAGGNTGGAYTLTMAEPSLKIYVMQDEVYPVYWKTSSTDTATLVRANSASTASTQGIYLAANHLSSASTVSLAALSADDEDDVMEVLTQAESTSYSYVTSVLFPVQDYTYTPGTMADEIFCQVDVYSAGAEAASDTEDGEDTLDTEDVLEQNIYDSSLFQDMALVLVPAEPDTSLTLEAVYAPGQTGRFAKVQEDNVSMTKWGAASLTLALEEDVLPTISYFGADGSGQILCTFDQDGEVFQAVENFELEDIVLYGIVVPTESVTELSLVSDSLDYVSPGGQILVFDSAGDLADSCVTLSGTWEIETEEDTVGWLSIALKEDGFVLTASDWDDWMLEDVSGDYSLEGTADSYIMTLLETEEEEVPAEEETQAEDSEPEATETPAETAEPTPDPDSADEANDPAETDAQEEGASTPAAETEDELSPVPETEEEADEETQSTDQETVTETDSEEKYDREEGD
jgi:hypothetical protein